ncbi:MAG: hypothetical protein GY820_14440 [Gammaproteobacteria bacterium]|nr:hypothetical protein [Gammaproteobacteria bacterium]
MLWHPTSKLLSLFFLFMLYPYSLMATDTVKVYLMAGQSNMEGNNTLVSRLETLVCIGGQTTETEVNGQVCGSNSISDLELTEIFLSTVENDYNDLLSSDPDGTITRQVADFLCEAGRITVEGQTCGTEQFGLDDRLFRTISQYYDTGTSFGYGYNAFMEMSAAQGVTDIFGDGYLTSALLDERGDVKVLQFQGALSSEGTLSFNERYGNLSTGFGSVTSFYGPELVFGHYLGNQVVDDVLLLKVVQGGTDLRLDWKTSCSSQNSGNQFTVEELAQESLYDALIAKARAIQSDSTSYFPEYSGKTIEIAGFLWFQGWNDGGCTTCAENYETNLNCLVSDLRNDLNDPDLPVVIIQSHRGDATSAVQVAQYNVAANTENTNLAITDDLSPYYHFDSAAQLAIGARAYEAMSALIDQQVNIPPSATNLETTTSYETDVTVMLQGSDENEDTLTYLIVTQPANGTLSVYALPSVTYTPDIGFSGTDSFTYQVSDGQATSDVATVSITVDANVVPDQWYQNQDIGDVGLSGSVSVENEVYTVSASGSDIYSSADSFHFVYWALSGDGSATVRVTSIGNSNSWAKGGVMIRESMDAGSKSIATVQSYESGVAFQYRTDTNDGTGWKGATGAYPEWVRIVREGDTFTGYHSEDGISWTKTGSTTSTMGQDVYIGIAATSHDNSKLNTTVFDNLQLVRSATDQEAPVAIDQSLSVPNTSSIVITLSAEDANNDIVNYLVSDSPDRGSLSGDAPNLTYTPNSSYLGSDSFDFTVIDSQGAESSGTIFINVRDAGGIFYESDPYIDIGDPVVYLHQRFADYDLTSNGHRVEILRNKTEDFTIYPEFNDKTNTVSLSNVTLTTPITIAFQMQPDSLSQNSTIISANTLFKFDQMSSGSLRSTIYNEDGTEFSNLTTTAGTLTDRSCNHVAVVLEENSHTLYLNGNPTRVNVSGNTGGSTTGLTIGSFPGKIWDIRIYNEALPQASIETLGQYCGENIRKANLTPYAGYPNSICGVYNCLWWPNDEDFDEGEELIELGTYQYYLFAQDRASKYFYFQANMLPIGQEASYLGLTNNAKDLILDKGIRRRFVRRFDYDNEQGVNDGVTNYWLHECYHSYQGQLAEFLGYRGTKWWLESTASLGPNLVFPGSYDSLLGRYSFMPHLPMWTNQSDPVKADDGNYYAGTEEGYGAHQYGAGSWFWYLGEYITDPSIIGNVYNDARVSSKPQEVLFELLGTDASTGIPVMNTAFADFTARNLTWDYEIGSLLRSSEEGSFRRFGGNNGNQVDFRFPATYTAEGTGETMTSVPIDYRPGSWAYNAYKIDFTYAGTYTVKFKADGTNPNRAIFQATVVVYDSVQDQRTYYKLSEITAGELRSLNSIITESGNELYLVVATTPNIFTGFHDRYDYQYAIYPNY